MSEGQLMFNAMMVITFITAIADHYIAGSGLVKRPVRVLLLTGFTYTEAYIAIVEHQPAMWLYVALNLWGIWLQFKGNKR